MRRGNTGVARRGSFRGIGGAPALMSLAVALARSLGVVLLDSQFGRTDEAGGRTVNWVDRTGFGAVTAGSGTTARPTFDGVNLVFDGVANVMKGFSGYFAGATGVTSILDGKATGGASESCIVNAGSATDYFSFYTRNNGHCGLEVIKTGPNVNAYQTNKYSDGWGIYCGRSTFANGVAACVPLTLNGNVMDGSLVAAANVSGIALPSTLVGIGGVGGTSAGLFAAMTVRFIAFAPVAISDADMATLVAMLATLSGMTKLVVQGAPWTDVERVVAAAAGYDQPSPYGRLVLTTDAEELQVQTTEITSTVQYSIGWRQNAGAKTVIDVSAVSCPLLSPGSGGTVKTIEIEAGPQTYATPPNPYAGSYPREIWLPPGRTGSFVQQAAPTRRLVIVGDSISVDGQAATTQQSGGFSMLIREDYPGRVTCVGAGGISLFDLEGVYGGRAALIAKIRSLADGTVTNELYWPLGTNDFGLNKWPGGIAVYQAEVVAVISGVASAFTNVWVQSPGPRTDIATNGLGQTFTNWVAATPAAVTAIALGNVHYQDGSGMYTLAGSADNLHPANAQQAAYKAAGRTAIGY